MLRKYSFYVSMLRSEAKDVKIVFPNNEEGVYNLNKTGRNPGKEDDTSMFVKSKLLESANALFPDKEKIEITKMFTDFEFTKSLFESVVKVLEGRTEEMEDLDRKEMMDMLLCIVFLGIREEYQRDLYKGIVKKSLFGKNSGDIVRVIEQREVDSDTMSWIGMCVLRGYACLQGIYISEEESNILLTCDSKEDSECISRATNIRNVKISPEALERLVRKEIESGGKGQLSVLVWILRMVDVYWLNLDKCDLGSGYTWISKIEGLAELSVNGCKGVSGEMDVVDGLKYLQRLEINKIPVKQKGIEKIFRLESLRKLSLRGCGLGGLLEHIGKLKNLKELDVSENSINKKDMKTIGSLTKLEKLYMRGCRFKKGLLEKLYIYDCGLRGLVKHIGELKNLKELNVDSSRINEEDMKTIGSLTNLEKLSMNNCRLSKGHVKHIGELKNLKELNVDSSRINEENIKTIGSLTNLEKLSMCDCDLEGLVKHIGELKNLKELDVTGNWNGINEEDMKTIGNLTKLEKLYMYGCSLTVGLVKHIGKLKNLKELDVDSNWNGIDEEDIKTIGNLTKLEKLSMCDCELGAGLVKHIGELKNLKELDVDSNWNGIGEEDMKTIGSLTKLEKLSMCDCELGAGLVKHIGELKNLKELGVAGNGINKEDMETIGNLTSLVKLSMKRCGLRAGFVKHIGKLENLKELDVDRNRNGINEEDMKTIGSLTRLKKLSMHGCRLTKGLVKHIGKLENLKELDVSKNGINEEDRGVIIKLKSRGVTVKV